MKVSESVVNLTQLKSIKTFADFQIWIKGIKNNSGEFDYIQLRQIDKFKQEHLLGTVLRLKNNEHDLEIVPIFPESMMDLIASSIIIPNARTFIPVIGVKMKCKSNGQWSINRNTIKHDIATVDLIKRTPKPFELDFFRTELESLVKEMMFNIKTQLR